MADLFGDARLQRVINLNEVGVSLDKLLSTLGTEDLKFSCTTSCKEQKLQVRLNERPLRTFMEALAELLPGQWKAVPGGYLLEMDAEAVRRRERWWRLFLGERERALAAQRAETLRLMREKLPEQMSGDPKGVQETPLNGRVQVATERAIYSLLPAPLQERIAGQMNDTIFYGAVLGSTGDVEEGATLIRFDRLPMPARSVVQERVEQMRLKQAPIWDGAALRFKNDGLTVRTEVVFPGERFVSAFHLSTPVAPDASALPLQQGWLMQRMRELGRAAPLTWRQLAVYQNRRVWQNDPPASSRQVQQFPPPRRTDVLNWLGDQGRIEFVADYYSTPSVLMKPSDLGRLSQPLKEELDYRAFEQDMSWKQRSDEVYLFRNNRWYRDDRLEVPAPLLERWLADRQAQTTAGPAPSPGATSPPNPPDRGTEPALPSAETLRKQLDWEAEVVTTLTSYQITNGLKWFVSDEPALAAAAVPEAAGNPKQRLRKQTEEAQMDPVKWLGYRIQRAPFRFEADRLLPRLHALQFYAGLSPAARTALIEGTLRVSTLNAPQRARAEYLVPQLALLSGTEGAANRARLGLQFRSQPSIRPGVSAFALRLALIAPTSPAKAAEQ